MNNLTNSAKNENTVQQKSNINFVPSKNDKAPYFNINNLSSSFSKNNTTSTISNSNVNTTSTLFESNTDTTPSMIKSNLNYSSNISSSEPNLTTSAINISSPNYSLLKKSSSFVPSTFSTSISSHSSRLLERSISSSPEIKSPSFYDNFLKSNATENKESLIIPSTIPLAINSSSNIINANITPEPTYNKMIPSLDNSVNVIKPLVEYSDVYNDKNDLKSNSYYQSITLNKPKKITNACVNNTKKLTKVNKKNNTFDELYFVNPKKYYLPHDRIFRLDRPCRV